MVTIDHQLDFNLTSLLFCLEINRIVLYRRWHRFIPIIETHHLLIMLLDHRCTPNINIRVLLDRFIDEFLYEGILLYFVLPLYLKDLFIETFINGSYIPFIPNPFLINIRSERQSHVFCHDIDIQRIHARSRGFAMENVTLLITSYETIWRQDSLYLMFNCSHLSCYGLGYVMFLTRFVID